MLTWEEVWVTGSSDEEVGGEGEDAVGFIVWVSEVTVRDMMADL